MRIMLSGLKLKQAITRSGLTQSEAARRLGTTRQNIHAMCTGGTRSLSVDMLYKMREHLGCEDGDLLVQVADPAPRARWGSW